MKIRLHEDCPEFPMAEEVISTGACITREKQNELPIKSEQIKRHCL